MLEAELRGKAPSGLQDREDLLTSAVLGLLQYVPVRPFWVEVFERTRTVDDRSLLAVHPSIQHATQIAFKFWPIHSVYGEPDALAYVTLPSGSFFVLGVEVKLHSEKHGHGADDQLVRYLSALADREWLAHQHPAVRRNDIIADGLIYLTVRPNAEGLEDSVQQAVREGVPSIHERLFGLHFQDIQRVASETCFSLDPPFRTMVLNVNRFLRRRRIVFFEGFTPPQLRNTNNLEDLGSFLNTSKTRLFSQPGLRGAPRGRFLFGRRRRLFTPTALPSIPSGRFLLGDSAK